MLRLENFSQISLGGIRTPRPTYQLAIVLRVHLLSKCWKWHQIYSPSHGIDLPGLMHNPLSDPLYSMLYIEIGQVKPKPHTDLTIISLQSEMISWPRPVKIGLERLNLVTGADVTRIFEKGINGCGVSTRSILVWGIIDTLVTTLPIREHSRWRFASMG